MSIFEELKRRNVIRVGFAYALFGWVIAQVADLALENFGAPDWVMKTLLFLMFVGFFVTLFIAWAYELTPEGIKREKDITEGHSITHQTGRKLDRMVIVVLLLAVGILLAQRYLFEDTIQPPVEKQAEPTLSVEETAPAIDTPIEAIASEPSVAVLPFVNMSSDPEQEYFSDGISEEILNVLTRIPNLKVAARTSSFQFKGKNLDIDEIGRQLQVNHVLEGSVRKSGSTIRITAQLIETDSGFHLWSKSFDRQLENIFVIQDEIAAAIAGELQQRLVSLPQRPVTTVNMDAYDLYLKGRGLVARRKEAELFEGIEILKSALEIEPGYAPAMATLAKAYVVLPYFSFLLPVGEARQQARLWATKALELEPDNVEALSVLGIVYNEVDINAAGARELLEQALETNPGSIAANNFLGDICLRSGDLECAMTYESKAAELDPLGTVQLSDLSNVYLLLEDYEKVIQLDQRALSLDPSFTNAIRTLIEAHFYLGNEEQLAKLSQQIETMSGLPQGFSRGFQVIFSLARGDQQQAREIMQQHILLVEAGQYDPVSIANEAVMLGDFDTAGTFLIKAYKIQDGTWLYPVLIRLPEQAPDSEPWQEFWRLPGPAALADIRRSHGLNPQAPGFGHGANR